MAPQSTGHMSRDTVGHTLKLFPGQYFKIFYNVCHISNVLLLKIFKYNSNQTIMAPQVVGHTSRDTAGHMLKLFLWKYIKQCPVVSIISGFKSGPVQFLPSKLGNQDQTGTLYSQKVKRLDQD